MFRFELYKALRKKELLLFFIIGIIIEVFIAGQDNRLIPGDLNVKIYKEYMNELDGKYTNKKQQWIMSEQEKYQEYIEEKTIAEEKYDNDKIDAQEYKTAIRHYKEASVKLPTLTFVLNRSIYLEEIADNSDNVNFFYDLDADDYIKNMGVDIVVILLITIFAVHIFGEDYNCGTDNIVATCEKGRKKLFVARLKCVLLISFVAGAVFPIIEYAVKSYKYDLGNLNSDIKCLESMSDCGLSLTIKEYLLMCTAVRIMAAILFGIIVSGFIILIKNTIAAYVVSVAVVYLPYLLYDTFGKLINQISLCKGFGVYKGFYKPQKIFGIHGMIIWAILYIIIDIIILTVLKKKKYNN